MVKTIIEDNSKEYEKRLNKIKETAETCIRSYRVSLFYRTHKNFQEQLAQKDAAIESYRQLLLAKNTQVSIEQVTEKPVIREEIRDVDRQTEEKLRLAMLEVARLKVSLHGFTIPLK